MWLDDVASLQTIQSVWGNSVRNRIVQTFDTKTERDSHNAALPNGSVAVTLDTGIVYVKQAGAWSVLEMPWRTFTMAVWGLQGTTPTALTIVSTTFARWRQSLGRCEVTAQCVADMGPLFNVNAQVLIGVPTPMVRTGGAGVAKVFTNAQALNYGGWAHTYDGNRVIVANVGQAAPPNAIINVPSGNTYVNVDANLSYECSATVDTP